jgi:hypothetical protein
MPDQTRTTAIRAKRKRAQRSNKKANMAPPILNTQMSPAQIAVHQMRLEGTLHKLTGDGELDEQDLEAEWQHKLETTPSWQATIAGLDDPQKKNFLRHRRRAFVEGMRKALARAQTKLEAQADLEAQAGLEEQEKLEEQAKQKSDHLSDLAVALVEFQYHRLRELDGLQRELPQDLPRLQELPQVPETQSQQGPLPKEYEALALAMLHRDRVHRENPEPKASSTYELSQAGDEAQVLARIKQERKKQYESSEEYLLHKASLHKESLYKEACIRKREKRKGELKAFDASQNKFDANQKEFKSKKEAFKASKKEAREQKREALEAEKEAKANGPLQEELAQQRREAKKKRKRADLEANPKAKDKREQRVFGFRYFSTEKARARAQKELSDIEVSQATRRQGLTCHFTDE